MYTAIKIVEVNYSKLDFLTIPPLNSSYTIKGDKSQDQVLGNTYDATIGLIAFMVS